MPTRASRRSALAESDTDDAASTPARASKADRNKRKSTIASPKIAQIVEEPEDDVEKEPVEADDTAAVLDSSNDLELRTRSITKSPSASPPKPLNGSLNASKQSNGHVDSSPEEQSEGAMKVFKSRNSRQSKTSVNEISFEDSDNEEPSVNSYLNTAHQSMVVQKTTFTRCLERIANSGSKKRQLSESFATELKADTKKESEDAEPSDEKLVSINNTPVRARRSIHDSDSTSDETPKFKAALEDLAKLRESFVAKGSPKSAKKSPIAEGTPVRAKTPQSAKKTPKISIGESDEVLKMMEDFVDGNDEAVVTPKSAKKLENGTPKTAKKLENGTPKTAEKVENGTPARVKTPKSAEKVENGNPAREKTPKSAKKSVPDTPGKSPKNTNLTVFGNHAMDITTNGRQNETINEAEPMEVDAEVVVEETLNKSGVSAKSSSPGSAKKYSVFGYVSEVSKASKRLSLASLPNLASDNEENDSDVEVEVCKPRAKSWGTSVTRPASVAIDASAKTYSPVVIKGQSQRVKGYSSDEDEGDEEEEASHNSFVDDEAEVGSEESITESEANYIREHELPDDGESIGSQDSDHPDDEEEEDEGSSFLASDNEDDQYSMDSQEEDIEEIKEKPRRQSRIIAPSSSEDDEPVVEKSKKASIGRKSHIISSDDEEEVAKSPAKTAKSPAKSPKSASKKALESEEEEEENEQQAVDSPVKPSQSTRKSLKSPKAPVETEETEVDAQKSKKMKRRRESDLNVSVAVKAKRARMSDSVVESPDNTTGIAELFEEHTEMSVKQKKAKKSQQPETVDVEKVINKCEEYMSGYTAEKKAKMAIKREKKAQKLAQKKKQAEVVAKVASDGLDSSNNSNKENALAPRKKNKSKIKKQKLVAGRFSCFVLNVFLHA